MSAFLLVLSALIVAAQTAVVVWVPSPVTIGSLVFCSLMFVWTFHSYRRMQ